MKRSVSAIFAVTLLLAGCGNPPQRAQVAPLSGPPAAVHVQSVALAAPPEPCTGVFAAHDLDHTTATPGPVARMFEGNGAGVAIGDLDDDGRLDVVLAHSHGAATLLWNTGELHFRAERLPQHDTRAVSLVDVDGDGRLDIVFTRRLAAPSYWHNTGDPAARFTPELLPNVARPAYAMAWGDLNGDSALDFVAASYDAELLTAQGNSFLMGPGAGVYVYTRSGERFVPQQLVHKSQALALALFDLNHDAQPDILVGNDFATPDQYWVRQNDGWAAMQPFSATSHSTMSFDSGDIDNTGQPVLFATDMKPYDKGVATLAEWQPMMSEMWSPVPLGDPQIVENVLQVPGATGFRNQAYARGVDATGWSWSGEFADLDNDGWLDLYVANGMIEAELFNYLPNGALVEQNQALHNDGAGHFVPMPQWGLGSARSGRGMAIADLDGDGDLDIVVNNLNAPSQLFENQLCGGASLAVDLRWSGSKNTRALGAAVQLRTGTAAYSRMVRAEAGYLSGLPARVQFGFPAGETPRQLLVRWPDGAVSQVAAPTPGTRLTITRE